MRKSDIAKLQSIISAERQRERNASAKKRKHKKSVRVFTQGAPHHVPKQRRTFDNLIKSSM